MRILIVSEYIAPIQAVAAIRWTKICKYIKQKHPGTHITVLTNLKEYEAVDNVLNYQHKDLLLEKEMTCFDKYIAPPHSFLMRLYYKAKRMGSRELTVESKLAEEKVRTNKLKSVVLELLHATKTKLVYWQMCHSVDNMSLDFDVIISSFGPVWPHLVAEYIKYKKPSVIWLADFRDPYASEKDLKSAYEYHKKFTMKHCATADAVIRVLDKMETFTPLLIPIYTIPNGFDPQERIAPRHPEKFSIVYTGVLYGKRSDIGIVNKALCDLCSEGKIKKKDVELLYAGPSGSVAVSLINRYHPKEIYLRDCGILPRTKVLDLQSSAAILLQAACNTQKEKALWTGKMYEYMMAKKPILYVDSGNIPHSDPSKNIHYLGGCCYEQCRHEETYPQMKAYILEKYQEWKATGNVSVQQDKEYIEQYSYPHIADQVWQLIQTQMERRKMQ